MCEFIQHKYQRKVIHFWHKIFVFIFKSFVKCNNNLPRGLNLTKSARKKCQSLCHNLPISVNTCTRSTCYNDDNTPTVNLAKEDQIL